MSFFQPPIFALQQQQQRRHPQYLHYVHNTWAPFPVVYQQQQLQPTSVVALPTTAVPAPTVTTVPVVIPPPPPPTAILIQPPPLPPTALIITAPPNPTTAATDSPTPTPATPASSSLPSASSQTSIKIRIIFYGHRPRRQPDNAAGSGSGSGLLLFTRATDTAYARPPTLNRLLCDATHWAQQHDGNDGDGDYVNDPRRRVAPAQARLYILPAGGGDSNGGEGGDGGAAETLGLAVLPGGVGPVVPGDAVRVLRLDSVLRDALEDVRARGHRAILAVDMDMDMDGDGNGRNQDAAAAAAAGGGGNGDDDGGDDQDDGADAGAASSS